MQQFPSQSASLLSQSAFLSDSFLDTAFALSSPIDVAKLRGGAAFAGRALIHMGKVEQG
jgi:hypothetical protein